MKFTEVKEMPKRNISRKRLYVFFEEFMTANVGTARVDFAKDDYASMSVARSVMATAAKKHAFPIRVCKRGDEIYLVRTDME